MNASKSKKPTAPAVAKKSEALELVMEFEEGRWGRDRWPGDQPNTLFRDAADECYLGTSGYDDQTHVLMIWQGEEGIPIDQVVALNVQHVTIRQALEWYVECSRFCEPCGYPHKLCEVALRHLRYDEVAA